METAKTTYELAREWYLENEARPISETVRILEAAYEDSRHLFNLTNSVFHDVRKIRDERYVSAANVIDIRQLIATLRGQMALLESTLVKATDSLDNENILEAAANV